MNGCPANGDDAVEFGLSSYGMSVVCDTCGSEIDSLHDQPDDTCVCRGCGIAFLVDSNSLSAARIS